MSPDLWLENLAAYSVQIALLVTAAAVLASALRLRNPNALYRGWQLLLVVSLAVPLLQPWREAALARSGGAPDDVSSAVETAGPGINLAALVLAVVLCGALLRLARLSLGLVHLRRLRRTGRRLRRMPEPLAELRDRLGLDADLYLSPGLDGAVSFGVRNPAVLLPDTFPAMDPPAQKAVLCHELLHIRRRDCAFALAEEMVRSLLWFHPAVWWVVDRIQLAREQVVDREVIGLMGERDPYLEALLHTAALRARTSLAATPTFLRTRHLKQRVALILKEDMMSKKRLGVCLATVVCALTLTGAWAVWSFPLQAPPTPDHWGPSGEVYRVGGAVSSPRLDYKIEPQYTDEAREAKLQGTVVLGIEVGPNGLVQDIQLRRGLGLGLDENAMDAVRQWEFSPALKDGQPVSVQATVEVNYRLM